MSVPVPVDSLTIPYAYDNLPIEEIVRKWDSKQLDAFLDALQPPPLVDEEGKGIFRRIGLDGWSFLDSRGELLRNSGLTPGVVWRLINVADRILLKTPAVGSTASRKRRGSASVEVEARGKTARLKDTPTDLVAVLPVGSPVSTARTSGVSTNTKASSPGGESTGMSRVVTATESVMEVLVKAINHGIEDLLITPEILSTPGQETRLPFPFPGPIPQRFHAERKDSSDLLHSSNGSFNFTGRSYFKTLYQAAKFMEPRQNKRLHLHGSLGAGKSYLLAALVCQLRVENIPVVYLPDCYELLMAEPATMYIIPAVYAAFSSDLQLGKQARNFLKVIEDTNYNPQRLNWELQVFFNQAAAMGKHIMFIVDQANALDQGVHDRVTDKKKMEVRGLLDGFTVNHMKIASSTANYLAAKYDEFRATSEKQLTLLMGLNEDEMEAWWARYEAGVGLSLGLKPKDREELERLTGKMPILLHALIEATQKCLDQLPVMAVSDKALASTATGSGSSRITLSSMIRCMLRLPEVTKIVGAVNTYASTTIAELRIADNSFALDRFRSGWEACIFEQSLQLHHCGHLDSRFYFRDNSEQTFGIGRSTSDLVRAVGTARIREIENLEEYAQGPWKQQIKQAGMNPCVLRFLVERVILGTLAKRGTSFAGDKFDAVKKQPKLLKFPGTFPDNAPKWDTPTVYIPTSYNYEAVDAVLVNRTNHERPRQTRQTRAAVKGSGGDPALEEENSKSKAVVVGIQITIAQSHRDSESCFMRGWQRWDTLMGCEETEFRFLWIVESVPVGKPHDWEEVGEKKIFLEKGEITVHPAYQRRYISVTEFNNELGEALRNARACTGEL